MPARPEEACLLPPLYEQKGLLNPDGNWLSKCSRQNQVGLIAVASPVELQNFDRLTGTRLQAIVPMMKMAGELLRGIASITERDSICMKW